MQFLSAQTADGLTLRGLRSHTEDAEYTVVHVHGYGGDFYSNELVRRCHELYPANGFSFVSFGTRTMAYLYEIYTEDSVTYAGSAVLAQDDVYLDIDAVIAALQVAPNRVVLQGHSFGTNIVQDYVRRRSGIAAAVFLSPADSVELHQLWRARHARAQKGDRDSIRWDLFGMAAGAASYPIPISERAAAHLLDGDVFSQWSRDHAGLSTAALVVQGADDSICLVGRTADPEFFRSLIPGCEVTRVPGARHLFAGFEDMLCDVVTTWLQKELHIRGPYG